MEISNVMAIPKLLPSSTTLALGSSSFVCSRRCFGLLRLPIYRTSPKSNPIPVLCQKMFVPGFAEMSPEAKAATKLHDFFTYLAVKIVLAQLESYNKEAYEELMEFVSRTSLNDGDNFCASLMRESPRHKGLAMRILEVRSTYAQRDFEWENLKRLAIQNAEESNIKLMREYLSETSHIE